MSALQIPTTTTTTSFSLLKHHPQPQAKPTNYYPLFLPYHPSCTSPPLAVLSLSKLQNLRLLPRPAAATSSTAETAVALPEGLRPELMPQHVAMILDGNGRWARQRGLPESVGHSAGMRNLLKMVEVCRKWGISVLTVFGFSYDNWVRPKGEVDFIMGLLEKGLQSKTDHVVRYGEIVDVNLVRDKATGKSKGFAFIAYEDQRSTTLVVDNLNGAQIAGRIIRVDHVSNYKKKEEEDEETERQKREERGVCRAFQRGECKYGDSCRFSHDEQRAANTGWGPEEDRKSRWTHDKFDNRSGANKRTDDAPPSHALKGNRANDYDRKGSRGKDNTEIDRKQIAAELDLERRDRGRRAEYEEGRGKQTVDGRSSRYESESKSRDDCDGREEKRSRRYETESNARDNREEKDRDRDRVRERERERDKGSSYPRDSSPPPRDRKDDDHRRDRRDDDHRRDRRDDDYRRDRKDDDQLKDKRGDDHRRGRHDDDHHRSRR